MSVDQPIDLTRALLLLGAVALLLGFLALRDRSAYKRFKALTESKDRIKHFRRWVIGAFLAFGVGGVLLLWGAGRIGDLARMPPEFAPMRLVVGKGALEPMLFGLTFGLTFGIGILVITARRAQRNPAPRKKPAADIQALMPRNGAERFWLVLLSLNAGVTEEIFFRVAVPLLIAAVTGSAIVAIVIGCVIFGLIHAYQGLLGIVMTTVLGAIFSLIYVLTGSLIFAMAIHVLIDLNTLVFLPWLRARVAAKAVA